MRKILFLTCFVVSLLFAACEKNEFADNVTPQRPGINISVADGNATRTAYSGFTTTFESGDAIGVYCVNSSGSVVSSNVRCVYNGTVWVLDEDVPYNATHSYYAYYPYTATPYTPDFSASGVDNQFSLFIADASNKFHAADQSTKAKYSACDLMIAQGSIVDDYQVSFAMDHKKGLAVFSGDAAATATFTGNLPYTLGSERYFLMKYNTSTEFTDNINGTYSLMASKGKYVRKNIELPPIDLSMVDNAGTARASRTTANCYMVHNAGKYKLPLVYGNAIKNGSTNTDAYHTETVNDNLLTTFVNHADQPISDPWIKNNYQSDGTTPITVDGATLVWQDAQGLISSVSVDGDYLKFEIPDDASTKSGNAVLAAKSGDQIVWSWHIWVTTETYASLTTIATGAHTYQVAPVNVGEANGGSTYYQWGRKDAFPTSNNAYNSSGAKFTSFTTASSGTIADNIKNPLTWYNVSSKPHDGTKYNYWDMDNTSTSDNRSDATVKTIYDPCPPGFCVPTSNLYNYMGSNSGSTTWTSDATFKGRTWTAGGANLKFPAAGFRIYSGGSLRSVGNNGSCWSATPGGKSEGRYLYFDSSSWALGSGLRSYGFSVRPVLEK